jgi:hypothetical protein
MRTNQESLGSVIIIAAPMFDQGSFADTRWPGLAGPSI